MKRKLLLHLLVLGCLLITNITYAQFCSATTTLTAATGTFEDGSGTSDYADNTDCSWLIQPSGATSITITFNSFATEDGYDFVNVYDGIDNTATLLGSFTGATIPSSITSSGGSLFINFTSDGTIVDAGWEISYTSCTGGPTATITPAGSTTLCNSTVTLNANTGSGLTYIWLKDGSTIGGATNSSYTATSSGSYVVRVFDSSGCFTNSSAITVTNNTPNVSVTASPDTICAGASAQLAVLSANFNDNFDPISSTGWTISNGVASNACGSVTGDALYFDGTGTRSATTGAMNVSNGGTVSFFLKIGTGSSPCEDADTGEEVVLEYSTDNGTTWTIITTYNTGTTYTNFTSVTETIPGAAQTSATLFQWRQLSNSGSSTDNWAIDDVSITGNNGSLTYSWTPSGGLSATNIANPVATINTTTTYSVQVDNSGCTSTKNITIVVNGTAPSANVTTSGSTTLCNSTVTLNAATTSGNTYQWQKDGNNIAGATSASYTASSSGVYTVKIINGACTVNSTGITVNNQTPQVSTYANPAFICSGTTQLNVTSGSLSDNFDPINSSFWTLSNGAASTSCGSVTGDALYFNGTGVRSATTNALNVASGGTIKFHLKIATGSSPCETADAGEDVVLEYSTDNGTTWTIISTYNTGATYTNFTSVTETIPAAAQSTATSFRWRQLSNSGTGFDNWAIDDVDVSSSVGSGYTYNWSPSTGLSSTTIANPVATVSATTTYMVQVTNGSCTYTDSVKVTLVTSTSANITANGNTTTCDGDTVLLTADPGVTYLWSNGATTRSIMVTQSDTLNVMIDYGSSCTSTSPNTIVTFNALPAASITSSGTPTICVGTSTLTLTANTGSGLSYQWQKDGADISGATNNTLVVTNVGEYSVIVTNTANCSRTSNKIRVNAAGPIYTTSATPNLLCAGQTSQLALDIKTLSDNFDPINTSAWTLSNGTTTSSCGSVSGDALYFDGTGTRSATTQALNVNSGGTISFYLKIGNGASPCEDADAGEEVVLEFSTDGGTTWTNIATYATTGAYDNFTLTTLSVPAAAQTTATLFQWRQVSNSGTATDNWALDEVSVTGNTSSYTYSWSPTTGLSDSTIANPVATVNGGITYTVTVSDGSCAVSDTVSIQNKINISLAAIQPCVGCCNGELTASVNGGSGGYTYSWSPAPGSGQGTATAGILCAGTYTLTVTDTSGCSNSIDFQLDAVSGVKNVSTSDPNGISIYPNPNSGVFVLKNNILNAESIRVSFTNIIGEELFSDNLAGNEKTKEYHIESLNAGIYFIQVQDNKGYKKTIKLVKN